jgi:hypothetical protein
MTANESFAALVALLRQAGEDGEGEMVDDRRKDSVYIEGRFDLQQVAIAWERFVKQREIDEHTEALNVFHRVVPTVGPDGTAHISVADLMKVMNYLGVEVN